MEYTRLGKSGLKVSKVGYGNFAAADRKDEALDAQLVKMAFDAGINFFDTAQLYGLGFGEVSLGKALRALGVPREDYVVSTKIFWGKYPEFKNPQNVMGYNRKALIEGTNASLKRLQMDYVDLLSLHRYDCTTSVEELCYGIKALIDQGKILYWGTSEWPAIRIMEAMHICDKIGCPRPIAEQCEYNLIERKNVEANYIPLFDEYGLGTNVWSPLAMGVLTGKYNDYTPDDSRFGASAQGDLKAHFDRYMGGEKKQKVVEGIEKLKKIAEREKTTVPALCVAWVATGNDISSTWLGASSTKQFQDNLNAYFNIKNLSKGTLKEVGDAFATAPTLDRDYITWKDLPPRRTYE
jgi:voltage-dependent potassium channel beta subunit